MEEQEHYHISWACLCIKKFWSRIFLIIVQITGIQVVPSPGLALLSLDIELFPPHLRTMVTHILLAARLTIVRHWKDNNPPTILETLQTTNRHSIYEKQFAYSIGTHERTNKLWSYWQKWYTSNQDHEGVKP